MLNSVPVLHAVAHVSAGGFFVDARWLPDACPHVAPGTDQGLGFNFRL